jgi:hypothetical protein
MCGATRVPAAPRAMPISRPRRRHRRPNRANAGAGSATSTTPRKPGSRPRPAPPRRWRETPPGCVAWPGLAVITARTWIIGFSEAGMERLYRSREPRFSRSGGRRLPPTRRGLKSPRPGSKGGVEVPTTDQGEGMAARSLRWCERRADPLDAPRAPAQPWRGVGLGPGLGEGARRGRQPGGRPAPRAAGRPRRAPPGARSGDAARAKPLRHPRRARQARLGRRGSPAAVAGSDAPSRGGAAQLQEPSSLLSPSSRPCARSRRRARRASRRNCRTSASASGSASSRRCPRSRRPTTANTS